MNRIISRWPRGVLPLVVVAYGVGLWFVPVPDGLTRESWHLFTIFSATIFAVIIMVYMVRRIFTTMNTLRAHDLSALKG